MLSPPAPCYHLASLSILELARALFDQLQVDVLIRLAPPHFTVALHS